MPAMFGGASGEVQVDRFRTFDVDGNIVRLSGVIENEGFSTGYLTNLIGMALVPFTFALRHSLFFLFRVPPVQLSPNLFIHCITTQKETKKIYIEPYFRYYDINYD